MKSLVFLFVLGIILHEAAAVIHSLKYLYTGSSGVTNFPEFVSVGLVDGVQIEYYDSNTRRAEPKQDWMNKVTADAPGYWERSTGNLLGSQQTFKVNIETAKGHFNQAGGVHIFQKMYGCEWNDETGEVNGFMQDGYDGEDFTSFDLQTETWIAAKQQAVFAKQKWDNDKALITETKQYLTQTCPNTLKAFVNYGRSSLMRTVRTASSSQTPPTKSPVGPPGRSQLS